MVELVPGNLTYYLILVVFVVGLYGIFVKQNFMKKLIGLTIFQSAIILFFIAGAYMEGATVPVRVSDKALNTSYMNPLPHTLMLTAIVVGVAMVGLALALLVTIYKRYQTLEESELLEKMQ